MKTRPCFCPTHLDSSLPALPPCPRRLPLSRLYLDLPDSDSTLPSSAEQFYLALFLASFLLPSHRLSRLSCPFISFTPSFLVVVNKIPSLSLHILIYLHRPFFSLISSGFFFGFYSGTYLPFDTTTQNLKLTQNWNGLLFFSIVMLLSDLLLTVILAYFYPCVLSVQKCSALLFLPLFWDGCFIRVVLLITALYTYMPV